MKRTDETIWNFWCRLFRAEPRNRATVRGGLLPHYRLVASRGHFGDWTAETKGDTFNSADFFTHPISTHSKNPPQPRAGMRNNAVIGNASRRPQIESISSCVFSYLQEKTGVQVRRNKMQQPRRRGVAGWIQIGIVGEHFKAVALIVLINFALQFTIHADTSFTALGAIKSKFFNLGGVVSSVEDYNFIVSVNKCYWEITLNPTSPTNDIYKAKFDGTNIYFIHDLSRAVGAMKKEGKLVGSNIANAMVVRGEVPHDPFAEAIGPIWLTYASMCYFEHRTNDEIEPMFSFSDSVIGWDQRFSEKAKWALSSSLQLPESLIMQCDGNRLTINRMVPTYNAKYKPPYDRGFKIVQYRVNSFTNIQGKLFPMTAVFETFGTKKDGISNTDLRTVTEHNIVTFQISNTSDVDNLPPRTPGETAVTDSRFLADHVIRFAYRCNDRLLTDSEVRQLPQYQKAKSVGWITPKSMVAIPESVAVDPRRAKLVRVILVTVAACGLGGLIYLTVLNKKSNNKQQTK
jgi:hypothetical protein